MFDVVAHNPAVGVNVYVVVAVLFNAGDQVPVIPLTDVVGNAVNVAPKHIGATWVNVGMIFGLTVIVIVAVVAHNPVVGVNVYVVVAVLSNAGDQVPEKPFNEVLGKAFNVSPEQIEATCINVGVIFGLTVIVIVAAVAHNPAVGVNVYVVVAVLFNAGDQVPEKPFNEVVGNAANVAPEHIGATCVNEGVIFGLTVIDIVAVVAHNPAVGVNVYVVVAVLFNAGDQVPEKPFNEFVGNAANVAPEHIGATCVNEGVIFWFTVIFIVAVVAQKPAVGVNV
jgi:hypothetical protein